MSETRRSDPVLFSRQKWIIAGTPVEDIYPCRCHERLYRTCSAAWCPCAGRNPDGMPPECCSWRFGPQDHVVAKAAWELKKRQEEELLG